MASRDHVVEIQTFIDERKVGNFQILVVALCALTVFLDGFDVQSIAFVAPSIAQDWQLQRQSLGPIFSASLVGILIGALFFGPVADKIGRRWVIMICTLIFGGCTLWTATSNNVTELLIFRLVTGLGLGGAMPNAIALTAEYCPQRRRATLVMIMFSGFSLGAAAGGAIAAVIIPQFGWRSVWYLGGALPLLLLPLQFFALPESIRFLVIAGAAREKIAALARRIDKRFQVSADARFEIAEARTSGVPVLHLFRDGRAWGTVLLWTIFFMNLLDLYFLQNWIPVITNAAGVPVQTAIVIGTLFQVGGVIACLLVGLPIDRLGAYKILPILFGLGCIIVVALGRAETSVLALMLLTFAAGFCVIGGQNGANVLSAIFYPTSVRSTGIGWSLGIGRVGAIIGPLIGGFLISLHWPNSSIFLLGGIPLLCVTLAVFVMGRIYRQA
jgi:MFS transporter, AAHS family, 4-hydroxybenzoate transporter